MTEGDRLAAAIDREGTRVLRVGGRATFDPRRVRAEMEGRRICRVILVGGANCCSGCRWPIVANPQAGCYEPTPGSGEVICWFKNDH